MIKAIIFDLGSVIYRTNWDKLNQQFRDKYGFDIRIFNNEELKRIYNDANIGKACVRDMVIHLGHKENADEIIEHYKKCYFDSKILNDKMLKIAKEFMEKYPVYIITDTNKEHYEANLEGGLLDGFKKVFTSHELGKRKSNKIVFEEVVKELGLGPEEILFIDDHLPNIENAKLVGLNVIHYDCFPEMEKFEKELGERLK